MHKEAQAPLTKTSRERKDRLPLCQITWHKRVVVLHQMHHGETTSHKDRTENTRQQFEESNQQEGHIAGASK